MFDHASIEIDLQPKRHDIKCEELEKLFCFKLEIINEPKIMMDVRNETNYPNIKFYIEVRLPKDNFTIIHIDEQSLYTYVKYQLQQNDEIDDITFICQQENVQNILSKYKIKSLDSKTPQTRMLIERSAQIYVGGEDINNFIVCSSDLPNCIENVLQRLNNELLTVGIEGYQIGIYYCDCSSRPWKQNIPRFLYFQLKLDNYDKVKRKTTTKFINNYFSLCYNFNVTPIGVTLIQIYSSEKTNLILRKFSFNCKILISFIFYLLFFYLRER